MEFKEIIKKASSTWIDNNRQPAVDFDSRDMSKIENENLIIIGMRRLGKTEFLKYINSKNRRISVNVKETSESGVPILPTNENGSILVDFIYDTLFLDLDDPQFSAIDFKKKESKMFMEFSSAMEEIIIESKIKLVLIDEIQRRVEWTTWLKGLIDKLPGVRFIATGSDATMLASSAEHGGTRFKIKYVGPIQFSEYLQMKNTPLVKKSLLDYIENSVFPSLEINSDISSQYRMTIEKQIFESSISSDDIKLVLSNLSKNPGNKLNSSALSKELKGNSDSSADNKKINKILEFLVQSRLVYKVTEKHKSERMSKRNDHKYYPANWNLWKIFSSHKTLDDLSNSTVPMYGFVFENMVISNIYSSYMDIMDQDNIFYYDDKKKKEADIFVNGIAIEIKSYDIFLKKNKDRLKSMKDKMSNFDKYMIVHEGETKEEEAIYNVAEFLKEKLWKTPKID